MLASPGVAARDPFPSGGILTRPFVTHIFNLTVVIQVHIVGNNLGGYPFNAGHSATSITYRDGLTALSGQGQLPDL
jgi:hypothetical protein